MTLFTTHIGGIAAKSCGLWIYHDIKGPRGGPPYDPDVDLVCREEGYEMVCCPFALDRPLKDP